MLTKEISGDTTLMALAETPRVLVLALVTGVGALVAPDGAATPRATVLPKKAMAPPVRSNLRLALDLPQRGIALSPSAALTGTPRRRVPLTRCGVRAGPGFVSSGCVDEAVKTEPSRYGRRRHWGAQPVVGRAWEGTGWRRRRT